MAVCEKFQEYYFSSSSHIQEKHKNEPSWFTLGQLLRCCAVFVSLRSLVAYWLSATTIRVRCHVTFLAADCSIACNMMLPFQRGHQCCFSLTTKQRIIRAFTETKLEERPTIWLILFDFICPVGIFVFTDNTLHHYSSFWWSHSWINTFCPPWQRRTRDAAANVSSSKTFFFINSVYTNSVLNARVHV